MITKDKIHIIAEIGVNHNGSLTLAKKMMLASKKCGANSVKFQTYSTDDIIVSNTKKANYQIKNTKNNESQYDMLKKYELDNKNYLSLINYAKKINIEFFSTACDIRSLSYLSKTLKLKNNFWNRPWGEGPSKDLKSKIPALPPGFKILKASLSPS